MVMSRIAPPRAGRRRRALRVVGWNVLVAVSGLALAAGGAELSLRLVWPFAHSTSPLAFVPGVGLVVQPGAEVRHTDLREFWTVQRANGLGFLDREPIDPRRAAESCHIAMFGDSFVAAHEVPIADKFHVRLEELAARALPGLDVTTSAWGIQGIGQIAQLPLYDAYARRMEPDIVVLVFVANDYRDNSALAIGWRHAVDPDLIPYATAARSADGAMTLRPPESRGGKSMIGARNAVPLPRPLPPLPTRVIEGLEPHSWLVRYLWRRLYLPRPGASADRWTGHRERWIETLRRRPHYAWILPGESAETREWAASRFLPMGLPRVHEYVSGFTAFALDLFKARADGDGAALVVFATPDAKNWAGGALEAMARERGIPVIDLHDYVARQGRDVGESHFAHDGHWNATGHLWAAEALLEWLARNRRACGGGRAIDETPARG